MTHKYKVHRARSMRTPVEVKQCTPILQTDAWDRSKEAIAKRVRKKK